VSEQEFDPADFERLVSRHFDSELSPEESADLIARLKADPASVRKFARASLMHDQLRTVFLSDLARESMEADGPADVPEIAPLPRASKVTWWQVLTAVAALVAGILVAAILTLRPWATSAAPVAVLSVELAAQWSDPNVGLLLRRGDLPAGPLQLESGVAEFVFADGATAVVEGPAVFEPLSRDRLSITSGRVVGRCPTKQARLTIVTPSAEVIDLGTEFGVAVGDDRNTQVAVIQGEVELVAAERARRMKAGDSVAIDAQGNAEQAAYVIKDLSKLARLIPGLNEADLGGENLLTDPEMTLAPAPHAMANPSSPWKGTAAHVDLTSGRAHSGGTAVRIRALGDPMWPLVGQDVRTGPIDGRVVAASVWAMQPAEDPLAERQNAIVKITFLDTAGREFASAERHFLRADSPKDLWVHGQIAAVAPPGTVAVRFQVLLNARGQRTGVILVDDARLSLAPVGWQPKTVRGGDKPTVEPALVHVVDIRDFSSDERLSAVCVEGLANRNGPRVYLNTGPSVRWMQFDFDDRKNGVWSEAAAAELKTRYTSICDAWTDILTRRGLCKFQTISMRQLLETQRGQISGVILYESLADDLAVAATMAGLRAAVPMTPKVYEAWGKPLGLPVVFDVRLLYAQYDPKQERRLEAHRWTIEHLLPECQRNGALSRDRTYGLDAHDTLIDVDLAVANRWITYDLSYLSPESRNSGDRPHPKYGFDLPDTPLLKTILSGLEPFSPIYGWGRPDENNLVRRLTLAGMVKICTGTANSSFYKPLPRMTSSSRQPIKERPRPSLEDKVYVAFMVNEGDTLKYLASLGNLGSWLQPERGKIAINWGMDPLLYREFPGLVSYFQATATENDRFFAATSGWGYTHPERLSDKQLEPYGRLVNEGRRISSLEYIDFWWIGGLRPRNVFYPFLQATGMRGVTLWSDHQGVEYAPDRTPIVYSDHYYTLGEPADFAEQLIRDTATFRRPWFVAVYGAKATGTPYKFHEVARRLPADTFKIVGLEELFAAAREARPQVEGRQLKRSGDKPLPPGAGQSPGQ
jgi:hypothetical protein